MTKNWWLRLARRNGASRARRKGVALVEIMVSVVVVTIGLMGVAGMVTVASRRASGLSYMSKRDGIVLQELNRIAAITYDSLGSRVGCTTVNSANTSHTRCISVTDISGGAGYKRVRVIVTPTSAYAKAETVYVNRSRGAARNPLAP